MEVNKINLCPVCGFQARLEIKPLPHDPKMMQAQVICNKCNFSSLKEYNGSHRTLALWNSNKLIELYKNNPLYVTINELDEVAIDY